VEGDVYKARKEQTEAVKAREALEAEVKNLKK
jgi:hypothetical protein